MMAEPVPDRHTDSIVPLLSNTSSDVYQQFSDVSDSYEQDTEAKDWELTQRALLQENNGVHVTFASSRIWKALSSQGSFQLSAMRTVLGLPIRVGDSYSGVSSWT